MRQDDRTPSRSAALPGSAPGAGGGHTATQASTGPEGRGPGVLLLLALVASALPAQQSPPAFDPRPRIEVAVEERIRSEDWDNIVDHRDDVPDYRTQIRFRTRVWTTWTFGDRLEVCAGLNNENRKLRRPDQAYHGREIIVETLYVDWTFSRAWSLRLGRQNLMRAEGLVLFDGTALDGSRTNYSNAVDLTWTSGRSRLELLAISDPAKDRYLPRINEAKDPRELQRLTEWDERALGFYLTTEVAERTGLEIYGFHKTETGDYRPSTNPLFQPDRRFQTLGARLVQPFAPGFTLTAEGALQRGKQDPRPGTTEAAQDIRAWGGYARLKKAFEAPGSPSFSLSYIGLSGDDPATPAMEGWDPVFGRWPKWSELYVYSQSPEKAVAYWTNTGMWELEARLSPWKPLGLRATWYRMDAFHPLAGATFGPGKRRGDLFQARADLVLGAAWKAHVLYEHLTPGSFYAGTASGHFFRMEVTYLFKTAW